MEGWHLHMERGRKKERKIERESGKIEYVYLIQNWPQFICFWDLSKPQIIIETICCCNQWNRLNNALKQSPADRRKWRCTCYNDSCLQLARLKVRKIKINREWKRRDRERGKKRGMLLIKSNVRLNGNQSLLIIWGLMEHSGILKSQDSFATYEAVIIMLIVFFNRSV